MYQLAIIGGGPAGYVAAEKASKAGLSVVLFEKENVGGVCLNVGCIPTKTLLYSAKQYHNAKHADKYGVSAENVNFDYAKIQLRKQKIIRKLVAGVKAKLHGVNVVSGEARVEAYSPEKITLSVAEQTFEAEKLLICTGSTNFVPPIPGLQDNPHIWDSTDALSAKELPSSVAIIGGGVIGMEFATLYMELGVEVTVIEALPRILPNIDEEAVAVVQQKYAKAGVRFLVGTKVEQIEEDKVFYSDVNTGEKGFVQADKILVSVGRRPNMAGLEALPLEMEGRGICINEQLQTSLPNVYAAGDVTAKIMLAHVASRQAEIAVEAMLDPETRQTIDYQAIPSVVYTNPEIAAIGLSEKDIMGQEESFEIRKLPMTFSGRFVAENEGETGLCKIIMRRDSQVIAGVQMVGNPCSEFVAAASCAVRMGYTMADFRQVVFPHPTVSEILKEVL